MDSANAQQAGVVKGFYQIAVGPSVNQDAWLKTHFTLTEEHKKTEAEIHFGLIS
jgi:hypothetical protein